MIKANKGEWSEAYAILKLMANGYLELCDRELIKDGKTVEIRGGKMRPNTDFKLIDDAVNFKFYGNSKVVSKDAIAKLAATSLRKIKTAKSVFEIPEIDELFAEIGNPTIKASGNVKEDCQLGILNPDTGSVDELGFTIKSELGGKPSLINAGETTNFIYKVNCSENDYRDLKPKTLVKRLNDDGVCIEFVQMQEPIFAENLMGIDTSMKEIIAHVVLKYYSIRGSKIPVLIKKLEEDNPVRFDDAALYKRKIRDLLLNSALGMVPSIKWDTRNQLRGGCIVAKKLGDIVGFYFLKPEYYCEFSEYLLNYCYLDTGSTSKHKFGSLYSENGQTYLKLNLNIRMNST